MRNFKALQNKSGQAVLLTPLIALTIVGLLMSVASNLSSRLDSSTRQMIFQMGMDGLTSEVMNVISSDTQCAADVVLPAPGTFGLVIANDGSAKLSTGTASIPISVTLPFSQQYTIPKTNGIPTTLPDLEITTQQVIFTPKAAAGKPSPVILNSDKATYTVSGTVTMSAMSSQTGFVAAAQREIANVNFHVDNTGTVISCYSVASAQDVCTQLGGLWYPTLVPACRFGFLDGDCNAGINPPQNYISGIDATGKPICSPWSVTCPVPAGVTNTVNTCKTADCTALVGIVNGMAICDSPKAPPPTPKITWAVASESASQSSGTINITVKTDIALSAATTVTITESGAAVLGTDYTLPSNTVVLPATTSGPSTASFQVHILNTGSSTNAVADFTLSSLAPTGVLAAFGAQVVNELTITPAGCSVAPQTWLTSCSGTPPAGTAAGTTVTVMNAATGFAGSAAYLCNANNTWTLQGTPAPTCAASTGQNLCNWGYYQGAGGSGATNGATFNHVAASPYWQTGYAPIGYINSCYTMTTGYPVDPNGICWYKSTTLEAQYGFTPGPGDISLNADPVNGCLPASAVTICGNTGPCASASTTTAGCYQETDESVQGASQVTHDQYHYHLTMAGCVRSLAAFECNGSFGTALGSACVYISPTDPLAPMCATASDAVGGEGCAASPTSELCGPAGHSSQTYATAADVIAAGLCTNGGTPSTGASGSNYTFSAAAMGTGPFVWNCYKLDQNGFEYDNEPCAANGNNSVVPGTCMPPSTPASLAALQAAGLCDGGTTPTNITTTATGWTWGCNGLNGGTNTAPNACSATQLIAGVCGATDGTCASGTASAMNNGSWTCAPNIGGLTSCFTQNHNNFHFDFWSTCGGKAQGNTAFKITYGASSSNCNNDAVGSIPACMNLDLLSGAGACSYVITAAQTQSVEAGAGLGTTFCGGPGSPCPSSTLTMPLPSGGACASTYQICP